MADFLCKVADTSGRVYSQVEAAQTLDEARQKLIDRGLFVYSVRPQGGFVGAMLQRNRKRAVGGTDFLVFNQQFNTLIRAGLPILKSLDLLSDRVAAPRLRPLLAEVRQRVREGALLSEALEAQGSFPKIYTTSFLAGEKSGSLGHCAFTQEEAAIPLQRLLVIRTNRATGAVSDLAVDDLMRPSTSPPLAVQAAIGTVRAQNR